MAGRNPVDVSVSLEGFDTLSAALRAEEDGKQLRKELAKNLRDALKPASEQARSGIMSMSAAVSESPALRSTIAKKIRPEVKLGGRWSGARVKARKTPGLRGFANAAKRTQAAGGWRTQIFGRGTWRTQQGKTDWFDRAMDPGSDRYRQAVHEAMEAMARRIADRAR
ncbi:hypothetical protein [Kitasatospora purpeofusca]|uniref:hypothetical protein n=1 Tax=Kitasatospora purpeofusca TaxID=67352 RepID=UPI002256859F|nr:hypothetical protein [Kitasatospora purpeofusca]MCX4752891.1 hypothetical protein [Kitasatospora purpeofusca]WSR32435.1 hypothetical protein OG715_16465 [Kitasatospora purpeofusca]WSR40522.1 hypothetical protein OG196_16245 [Kitasatospora purpeofusca]